MPRRVQGCFWFAILASCGFGQVATVFFSTNGTEVASGGAGGTSLAPGNQAAVLRDEAIAMVSPAAGSRAVACAHRTTWAALFGDDDGDGDFVEGVIGKIDALWLPPGTPNPPSAFDFWISVSDDLVGPMGGLMGSTIRDGDVFRALPGGGVQVYLTEALAGQAMANAMDFNIDGFARNAANGDLYWSMSTTQTVNGISVEDGGLIRLPGTAYILGANGTITSVTPGAAQIALHEVHVNIIYTVAGQGLVGDLRDFALDPLGGTFTATGGITIPNFWLCGDTAATQASIVSTRNGGLIPQVNGVSMIGGPAFGLAATDYGGLPNSSLTGLEWSATPLTTMPRTLTVGNALITTPGDLKLDLAGNTGSSAYLVLANFGVTAPAGAFQGLTPVLAGSNLAVVGGFRSLLVDDFLDPLFNFTLALPPVITNAQGYGSVTYPLPLITAGLGLLLQGIEVSTLALTTPVLVVFQ